ncbi:TonB family protein [Nodosilinea sp. P-1105]|uniref:TonB family protein n=1 Tax=Nodosilinea sp. P-1105 TaxID=2546229 RepID=UPI00146E5271|nr:TonB family protein [Nodosilinea sp. P-1105]NMF84548.1 TonB family protein [Nodosilinea sp. P-1105]
MKKTVNCVIWIEQISTIPGRSRMSLSDICGQQHQQEQQKLRKILLWGLLGSVGVHAIGFSLSQFSFWQAATEELSPIELIVTEAIPDDPETLVEPEQPTELSTETNDPAPPAASAPPRPAAVVAPPTLAPPPVESVTPDSPEPDTQAESDLEEAVAAEDVDEESPEGAEQEAPEVVEEAPEAVDLDAIAAELDAPQVESQTERLRDLLQRLREAQAQGNSNGAETDPGPSTTAGRGNVPEAPAGNDTGVAAAPSNTSGSGQGQGNRTVACQNCVRPSYPQSALNAGAEGQPMVNVDINPDGSVRNVTLTRSSGNAAIDQAAIQAARQSRFQPIAGGATSVPIEYDLTIEGSRRNRDARRRGERQSVEVPTPPPAADTPEPPPAAATPAPEPSAEEADTPPTAETPAPPAPASTAPEPAASEPSPPPASTPEPNQGGASPERTTPAPEPATPAAPLPVAPPPVTPPPATPPPATPPSPVEPPPASDEAN